jgi:hypothetical protein
VHHHTRSFCEAAGEVYSSTIDKDRAMRAVVVGTLKAHPALLDWESFKSVFKNTELGFDLLMSLTESQRKVLKRDASSV